MSIVVAFVVIRQNVQRVSPPATTFQPSITPTRPVSEVTLLDIIQNKRWMVVFQNPYELRATGGFWGTIGDLFISTDGHIQLTVRNVYDVDGPSEQFAQRLPKPPAPLQQYMKMDRWYLRDANWSPNFEEASRKGLELYEIETARPSPYDGVIAVTPIILSDILHVIGPVVIDGERFDEHTALDTIIESVELNYAKRNTPFFRRKEILEKLSIHLIDTLKKLPSEQLLQLIQQFPRYQQERVIQLYAKDESTQQHIRRLGWSGRLQSNDGDYVFVVDSNLAAFKTDAVVKRSTQYSVTQPSGQFEVELHLLYQHTKKVFDYRTTRYRSYTRVFVPIGSTLLSSSGTLLDDRLHNPTLKEHPVDVTTVEGKTQIGFFIAIEPGDQREVILRYRLPSTLSEQFYKAKTYSLLVQHQAGVPQRPLTLRVQSVTTPKPPTVVKREGKVDEFITVPL